FLLRESLGSGTAAFIMMIVMLPFFLFGLYEKNGMGLEKIIGNVIKVKFLMPSVRRYETRNLYSSTETGNDHEKE
ncbi:MAG: PrgI family protein, partial [Lachnospiraceae bacterium]|nr:PrgI family protein [Lachnospiraceae bacterium]